MSAQQRQIVVLSHRVHPAVLELLDRTCDVVPNQNEGSLSASELQRRTATADALMVFMPDRIDAQFLDACPRLRVIAAALKGYDNIDVDACTARGIWLTCVEDLLTGPTAELAVGLLIGLARNVIAGDRRVRAGFPGWRPVLYGRSLIGASIGIVGAGAVGQAVARLLRGFDARLRYSDPQPVPHQTADALGLERVTLTELLTSCDAVIVCAPLLNSTAHLLDRQALASTRPGALLVNVGRGSVVCERAVADLLRAGHLGGYAADVFEFEDVSRPQRPGHPHPDLIDLLDETLFTPHLGSAVGPVRLAIERRAATSILHALAGDVPDGAVNNTGGARPFTTSRPMP
ncbi:phosphonate dehydrogenase [Mycobacterium montefiorense]|uniref:D-glycerate dehydrogenase n=1 Tax=Mycobacterium montefiorense TaxID=154654 RepID=A0AA37ULY4_9MYCO|nr:phosphonate dehydrogenase [Mycobacterium montefiorense]GBG37269.1 D-glycerate dehydrogenase [Mycobacterium montefiorense]GKU35769.1 D-glycerate dehydrogenase [Mycobacterium montefiorense]GKU39733.1 D-glycerate dehydrogenase [Mycobacterium montefiorense]GKU47608.1 D-glycerate dehydrogenase [Mycobacterium montefiorense]GKU48927.1 D-glycerate dehydrogenase [Mycobacterium montefiorense]